jgi:protocatechuate 3,4-dioxygenase beta subunit
MNAQPTTFTGAVVDRVNGAPVGGATVTIHRLARRPNGDRISLAPATTHLTGLDGRFTFDIPPQQLADPDAFLYFEFDHPDYLQRSCMSNYHTTLAQAVAKWEAGEIMHMKLDAGEAVTGTITDHQGQPLAGVTITSRSVGGALDHRFITHEFAFGRTQTDPQGRFRFSAVPGALITHFRAESDEHAILFHDVRDQRGELGTFRLCGGIRLSGTVLDQNGRPVPNVGVKLESLTGDEMDEPIAARHGATDDHGRFALGPLSQGGYRLEVTDLLPAKAGERTIQRTAVPAAFAPMEVMLVWPFDGEPRPIEVRAVPQVTVRARYVDTAGQPIAARRQSIVGLVGEHHWRMTSQPLGDDTIQWIVPRGLQGAFVTQHTLDKEGLLRWKRGSGPLEYGGGFVKLGRIDQDIDDLVFVHCRQPVVSVRVLAPDGSTPHTPPRIDYPSSGPKPPARWVNGIQGDVFLTRQDDGSWRTEQLLPDLDFALSADAPGLGRAAPQTMRLAEGEVREITLTLS